MKRMKWKNRLQRKLRGCRGESIAEVLVAVLISALGLALLAGMISGAVNLIQSGEESMQEYVERENALAARTGASEAGSVHPSEKLTDGSGADLSVRCYRIEIPGGEPVVSYEAGDGA